MAICRRIVPFVSAMRSAALFIGALIGAATAGRWRPAHLAPMDLLRAWAGGDLMGWGSLLVPGSNDGLIFTGIPLLQPSVWWALPSMVASIAVAMCLQRTWQSVGNLNCRPTS